MNDFAMFSFIFVPLSIVLYAIYCFKHWSLKGVPCLPVKLPFVWPCFMDAPGVVSESNMVENYRIMKTKGYKYAGVVTWIRGVLIVKDLKLIRDILIENKRHFGDRGFHYTNRCEPDIGKIMILDGTKWREMRSVLNPNVLCNKLTLLFGNVLDVLPYLIEAIEDCAAEERDIDVKELFTCFTTDVITYHCYQVNCHSYWRSSSEFCKCQIDRLYSLGLRTAKESVSSSLYHTIRNYMRYREEGAYQNIDFYTLSDFMKDWSMSQEEQLQLFEMVIKTNLFFYLSFDVTSTTLNFAVYELCRNPDIQDKVRREIHDVLIEHGDEITWTTLKRMTFLDQVIDETLRLYPPAANLIELCNTNGYKLRDTNVKVSTITDLIIPLFSIHRDPEYFRDPEKFDPVRFRPDGNPKVFMPYGEGPRECESIQACTIQTKVGLVQILRNFRLTISPKTRLPLRLKPQAFITSDMLYINAEKI